MVLSLRLLPIDERGPGTDEREQLRCIQPSPALPRHPKELVSHHDAPPPRARPFRDPLPEPHRGEAGLDRVRRLDVFPVLSREVVEREQLVLVAAEATLSFVFAP